MGFALLYRTMLGKRLHHGLVLGIVLAALPLLIPSAHAAECAAKWYYAKDVTHVYGPYYGCQDIPDEIDGDPQKWCATETINVYFSNRLGDTNWDYCTNGDDSKCVQNTWNYYHKLYPADKDAVLSGIFGGVVFPKCTSYGADTSGPHKGIPWCATQTAPTYFAGKNYGTNWQYCGQQAAPPIGTNGGTGNASANATLAQAWTIQKPVIDGQMTDLVKSTLDLAAAKTIYFNDTKTTFESTLQAMLDAQSKGQAVSTVPSGSKVIPSKATYDTALQTQKDAFTKLNTTLSTLLKIDPATTDTKSIDDKTREILAQVSMIYVNTFLTLNINGPLTNSAIANCTDDPIQNQHIYKGNPTSFIAMIHCLPMYSVNRLDRALTTAFFATMELVKLTHPNYAAAIQDRLLSNLVTYFVNLNDMTRWNNAASNLFIKLYADRIKTIPDNTKLAPDTNVQVEAFDFALYNPTGKTLKQFNLCSTSDIQKIMDPKLNPQPSAGELAVWEEKYSCMIFKNFIKAAIDPAMNTALTCSFWDTARLGKSCLQKPIVKTSWLNGEKIKSVIESLFISTAYADTYVSGCNCTHPELGASQCEALNKGTADCIFDSTGKDCKSDCAAGAAACAKACASPPSPTPNQNTCQPCTPTPACDDFEFLFINNNNTGGVVKTTQMSISDENGKVVCPPGSPFSCGIPYTLKKCLMGNPNCSAKGYPNNNEGCLFCDTNKQGDRETACSNLKVCSKANATSDPLYSKAFCGKCQSDSAQTCQTTKCGNTIVEAGEECDDGNTKDGDGCSSKCKKEQNCTEQCMDYTYQNNSYCKAALPIMPKMSYDYLSFKKISGLPIKNKYEYAQSSFCKMPDDVIDAQGNVIYKKGDPCDKFYNVYALTCAVEVAKCNKSCGENSFCGDDIVEGKEECDDGNPYADDACLPDCTRNLCKDKCESKTNDTNYYCKTWNQIYVILAKIIKSSNATDDNMTVDKFTVENYFITNTSCKLPMDVTEPSTKVTFKKGGPCDTDLLELLDSSCQLAQLACQDTCKGVVECGNGIKDPGEECDDGNTDPGDGCTNGCKKGTWCPECGTDKLAECKTLLADKNTGAECWLKEKVLSPDGKQTLCPAGAPCACQWKFDALTCKTAQDVCFQGCVANHGPKPADTLSDDACKTWKEIRPAWWPGTETMLNSNSYVYNDAGDQVQQLSADSIKQFKQDGADIFLKIWPQVISWAEYFSDATFNKEELESAKYYGLILLENAEFNINGCGIPNAVACYDPGSDKIYWANFINQLSPQQTTYIGAHEATHAALRALLLNVNTGVEPSMTPKALPLVSGSVWEKLTNSGDLDHWIMNIIQESFPGFEKTPLAGYSEFKDSMCPDTP